MIRLQMLVVCGLGVSIAGCGTAAPTAPQAAVTTVATIPSNIAGVWHGYVTGTACLDKFCQPASMYPFTLRVAPGGAGWTGSVEIREVFSTTTVSIDVSGTAQPDGSVLFSGSRNPVFHKNVKINRLRVKTDPSAGLVGDFDLVDSTTSAIISQTSTLSGAVVSASYQPIDTASISGAWEGAATMRSCQAGCANENVAGLDEQMYLLIGANGVASVTVTGSVEWLPLNGVLGAATFSGASPLVQYTQESRQIEQFSVSVDNLGRISSGSFVVSGVRNIGGVLSPFRWTMEVLWLARP